MQDPLNVYDVPPDPFLAWAKGSIRGHKKKGIKVEVTAEFLVELGKHSAYCPICGVPLAWDHVKSDCPSKPSLDRIDNEMIITEDNIVIVCSRCNSTKSNRTMDNMLEWCKNFQRFAEDYVR